MLKVMTTGLSRMFLPQKEMSTLSLFFARKPLELKICIVCQNLYYKVPSGVFIINRHGTGTLCVFLRHNKHSECFFFYLNLLLFQLVYSHILVLLNWHCFLFGHITSNTFLWSQPKMSITSPLFSWCACWYNTKLNIVSQHHWLSKTPYGLH